MNVRKTVFRIVGLFILIATVALATAAGKLATSKAAAISAPAGKAVAMPVLEEKNSDASVSALDPFVARKIADEQAAASLRERFRTQKLKGAPLGEELQGRIASIALPRPDNGHLDQGGENCAGAEAIAALPYTDFGTTAGYNDDMPECDGSGNGPDVVYSYMPAGTADFHVSLCGSSYDTKISVYEGSCTGTPIACNDDGPCWPGSDIPRVTLTGGINYYFVIDGWGGDFGDYAFFLEELAPTPAGDDCTDPIVIGSLPFSHDGASTCAYTNSYSGSTCLTMQDEGLDVVYSFTLTTTTSVEIIMTVYDAGGPNGAWTMPAMLLSDHCPPDFSCIASASSWTAIDYIPLVIPCTTLSPGTYWIVVDNGTWFHPCFNYDLLVQTCGPCDITGLPGDIAEVTETFPVPGTFSINDPDGGCNNDDPFPAQYQTVAGGQTVFGRTFAYTDSITGSLKLDSDWYRYVVTTPVAITCTYQGESSLGVTFIKPPCPGYPKKNGIQTTPCGTRSFTTNCLGAGEYYFRITRGAVGVTDAAPLDYRVTFDATPCVLPLGRCCYAGICSMFTEPECDALYGYWDESITCDSPCEDYYPPNDFCDNAGVPSPLPATFTGNNRNATNDCPQEGDPQVWHVFSITEQSDIQIDYCGTPDFHSFSPRIYTGCPCDERYELIAVDWGFCSPNTAMTGYWLDVPPGTYYVSVFTYNPNSFGEYTIHVNAISTDPPANDECATAEPLVLPPLGSVNVTGTTMFATQSCFDICSENGFSYNSSGGDVFYSLNLTQCQKIAMALGTSDMHLSVYQGADNCCISPAFLCNDDDANFLPLPEWDQAWQHPGGSRSYIAAALDPGQYIIRVAKYGGGSGYYDFTIYDNGNCFCTPPSPPTDLTLTTNDNNLEMRWTTDAESAARGQYTIWYTNVFGAFDDQTWTILLDNIVPVAENNHLYYSAPVSGLTQNPTFYVVTGKCVDQPAR